MMVLTYRRATHPQRDPLSIYSQGQQWPFSLIKILVNVFYRNLCAEQDGELRFSLAFTNFLFIAFENCTFTRPKWPFLPPKIIKKSTFYAKNNFRKQLENGSKLPRKILEKSRKIAKIAHFYWCFPFPFTFSFGEGEGEGEVKSTRAKNFFDL